MLRICMLMLGMAVPLCSSAQQIDYVKEITKTLGTIDALSSDLERNFRQLRFADPSHSAYYNCMESRITPDAVIDKLRPYYKRTFTESNLQDLYGLLMTDTGKKMVALIKAGPPFDNARSKLQADDIKRIEEVAKTFQWYFNSESSMALQRAVSTGAAELAAEAKISCKGSLQSQSER